MVFTLDYEPIGLRSVQRRLAWDRAGRYRGNGERGWRQVRELLSRKTVNDHIREVTDFRRAKQLSPLRAATPAGTTGGTPTPGQRRSASPPLCRRRRKVPHAAGSDKDFESFFLDQLHILEKKKREEAELKKQKDEDHAKARALFAKALVRKGAGLAQQLVEAAEQQRGGSRHSTVAVRADTTAPPAIQGARRQTLHQGSKPRKGAHVQTLQFDRLSLPFSHSEYLKVVNAFEELDSNKSGSLDWSELCGVETKLNGFVIDYDEYTRLGATAKGAIGFFEVLKVLFPQVPAAHLRAIIKKWGEPHEERQGFGGDWRDVLLPQECNEIREIYSLFTRGGTPLTFAAMQAVVPSVDRDDLKEVFNAHDADGDGILSLDEFASLLDIVFGRRSETHSVRLYFQPEELMRKM